MSTTVGLLEALDQLRGQMQRANSEFGQRAECVGTPKDSPALRQTLERIRQRFVALESKADSQVPRDGNNSADPALRELVRSIAAERAGFAQVNRRARAAETAAPLPGGAPRSNVESGQRATQTAQPMTALTQMSLAELDTEEALQLEKLRGILDVERDVNELRAMFREARELVMAQQEGLNRINANIDSATRHVRGGTDHLRGARRLQ